MTTQGATLPKLVSILPLTAALLIGSIAGPATAQVMLHVTDETELADAIDDANADLVNAYTILLDADITLTRALPAVTSIVTIAAASGDTIERSSAPGTPAFRILTLTAGTGQGHLTLERITVANGLVQSQGTADGGGIWVGGSPVSLPRTQLDLIGVTVRDNRAQGLGGLLNGGNTRGGGVFVSGESILTVEGCLFENNRAIGTQPAGTFYSGGFAIGGAIHCRLCRSSNIHDSTFRGNVAQGGNGPRRGPDWAIPSAAPTRSPPSSGRPRRD